MLLLKMRNSRLALLIIVFKLMTSNMSDPNHHQHNRKNCSGEEHCAVLDVTIEIVNSSLQDSNYTSTLYETVVVRVASPIDVYFPPCLITVGIGGNMLALYVFFSSKLRHQSTSQYLSALAISDSLFLGELFPPWLSTIEINSIFHRGPYCKGFVYISYVTCCLSSWLVIAFTVERFVAVQYPLQRPSVCTVRRARYIILTLTLGSMLVNLPVIHFTSSEDQVCHIDKEKLDQAAKFNWVDTTVTFTIPLILIIFFNTWIAAVVYKLEKNRIKLTQEEVRAAATVGQPKARDSDFFYLRSQRRITNMLLIVSTIFVLFNCPAYTLRVCGYNYVTEAGELDDKWLTAQKVATMMFNANFGINFFLYCLTGQNFRRALVQAVPCCAWLARKFNALFRRSPAHHRRTGSVTTSAASTGTDATCTELPFARPTARRARRRSGNYIMRWTFDNSRQRRGAAVSGASESIMMHEIASQPGPSRLNITDQPGPSHASFVRTRAIIEPRPPVKEPKRSNTDRRGLAPESRLYAVEPRRPAVEPRRASIDSRRPVIVSRRNVIDESRHRAIMSRRPAMESRRTVIDLRRPGIEPRYPVVDPRPSSVDLRRAVVDPRHSVIDLMQPGTEQARPVLTRANGVVKRKSSCI